MKRAGLQMTILLGMVILVTACGGPKRPVLYPNEKLNFVGQAAAKKDIDECIQRSVDAGLETEKGKEVAGKTVGGSAVGAFIGGAIGLVTGNVGRAVAIGAAGGGATGLARGATNRNLDPVQQRFVEKCLHERGYEPIGWK